MGKEIAEKTKESGRNVHSEPLRRQSKLQLTYGRGGLEIKIYEKKLENKVSESLLLGCDAIPHIRDDFPNIRARVAHTVIFCSYLRRSECWRGE